MTTKKISLASDNWSPAHPLVIESMMRANEGYAPAYGLDPWTEKTKQMIQQVFKKPCQVLIVPTGTGANVLGLKMCCKAYESALCADSAHIHYQETGAAEALVGCKLLTVPSVEGKITPDEILKRLKREKAFGRHSTLPRVLSITQPTEVGTVYTLQELKTLASLCKQENLLIHMDGSRLYNAAVRLNAPLHEIIDAAQVDILSLGGTKNGLMGAEALVIFNPSLQEGSDHLHKQMLQLPSKMRYLSAQYLPFFTDDLWHTLATHANQKAKELAAIIQSIPDLSLSYPVETNQVFFKAPPSWIPLIQDKIFSYLWNDEKSEMRFITSWNTSNEEVKEVKTIFEEMRKTNESFRD